MTRPVCISELPNSETDWQDEVDACFHGGAAGVARHLERRLGKGGRPRTADDAGRLDTTVAANRDREPHRPMTPGPRRFRIMSVQAPEASRASALSRSLPRSEIKSERTTMQYAKNNWCRERAHQPEKPAVTAHHRECFCRLRPTACKTGTRARGRVMQDRSDEPPGNSGSGSMPRRWRLCEVMNDFRGNAAKGRRETGGRHGGTV
jgi:hypothetical protein